MSDGQVYLNGIFVLSNRTLDFFLTEFCYFFLLVLFYSIHPFQKLILKFCFYLIGFVFLFSALLRFRRGFLWGINDFSFFILFIFPPLFLFNDHWTYTFSAPWRNRATWWWKRWKPVSLHFINALSSGGVMGCACWSFVIMELKSLLDSGESFLLRCVNCLIVLLEEFFGYFFLC